MTLLRTVSQADALLLNQIAQTERKEFSQPLSEQELKNCTQKDFYRIFALTEQDLLLAYAVFCLCGDEAQILSVASTQKRRGYAHRLLAQSLTVLQKEIHKINLEVRASNIPAQQLYKKLGFQLAGRRKSLYEKPTEDGYIMYLEMKEC